MKKREPTTRYHSFVIENESGVRDILLSPLETPRPPDGWHMIGRQGSFDLYADQLPVRQA